MHSQNIASLQIFISEKCIPLFIQPIAGRVAQNHSQPIAGRVAQNHSQYIASLQIFCIIEKHISLFIQPIAGRVAQNLEIISKKISTHQNSAHGIYD